jgi:hypothetical protein
MKVTNKDLLQINASLQYLAGQQTEAWYQISRNLKKVEPFVTELNEARQSIIEKLVKKDKEGNWLYQDEAKTQWDLGEDQEKADKLWEETQIEEVEIDFYTFTHDVLAGVKLNPQAITPLLDTIIVEK